MMHYLNRKLVAENKIAEYGARGKQSFPTCHP